MKHKSGSMKYEETRGEIKVKRAGYYFVYSQMFYADGGDKIFQLGHDTYISDKKVMSSVESITSKAFNPRQYHTKYHGGVFHVKANGTISVRATYTNRYQMDPTRSFFGAFLLHF